MIRIPEVTAPWFTDESFEQLHEVSKAWKRVYKYAKQGKCYHWKSNDYLSYCVTPSLYEDGALQVTHFVNDEPSCHVTCRTEREFVNEVHDNGVNVYLVR